MASELDGAPAQGLVGRFVIIISSDLIIWSSSVKCHRASIVRISLTWLGRFHTVNTLTLITAVSAAERPFSFLLFFCSELSCRGRGGGVGGLGGLWKGYTSREAVYTSRATQKKMHDFLQTWRLTQRLHLLISERLERPRWQICGISLFVDYLLCTPKWYIIYAQYSCKEIILFVVGESSSISLVKPLSAVTAYMCEY